MIGFLWFEVYIPRHPPGVEPPEESLFRYLALDVDNAQIDGKSYGKEKHDTDKAVQCSSGKEGEHKISGHRVEGYGEEPASDSEER